MLTSAEKKEMFSLLKHFPSLFNFIKSIDDGSLKLPWKFKNFITSLASPSPVCGYIHPSEAVCHLMKDLISGYPVKDDPFKWQQIHNYIPVLFEVLEHCQCSSAPAEFRPLLQELLEISVFPFTENEKEHDKEICDDDELAFFPSLPTKRGRGMYSMDTKRVQKGHPSLEYSPFIASMVGFIYIGTM